MDEIDYVLSNLTWFDVTNKSNHDECCDLNSEQLELKLDEIPVQQKLKQFECSCNRHHILSLEISSANETIRFLPRNGFAENFVPEYDDDNWYVYINEDNKLGSCVGGV